MQSNTIIHKIQTDIHRQEKQFNKEVRKKPIYKIQKTLLQSYVYITRKSLSN